MQEHTKEPWSINKTLEMVCDAAGENIKSTPANLRRIVAAVNACKRFSTELLEAAAACGGITADPTAELIKAEQQLVELRDEIHERSNKAQRMVGELEREKREAGQQRDDLLARANHYEAENGRQAEMLNEAIQQRDELEKRLNALATSVMCDSGNQRDPLTKEQIHRIVMDVHKKSGHLPPSPEIIVRAIEQAHGIGVYK